MRTLFLAGVVAAASSALGQITINCNIKDGQRVSGEVEFFITVTSKNFISGVEFYVGPDLRTTDESSPYEFRIDTIAEKEGPLQVRILAYSTEGERKELKLNLVVDNEVAKGADYHVTKGNEATTEGKWAEAIKHGRIALKVTPKHVPARLLLARANFGRGVYDLAQKFLEDLLLEQPNNLEALDLKAVVDLRRAFTAEAPTREASANVITRALRSASESRARTYTERLEKFGEITAENRMSYLRLAMLAARFSRVIDVAGPLFRENPRQPAIANVLLLAQLRANRFRAAAETALAYERRGGPDAAGWALIAIQKQRAGDAEGSLAAEREAIRSDSGHLTVRSAQAWLALMRQRGPAFTAAVNDFAKDAPDRVETLIMRSIAFNAALDFERARSEFERAVQLEPASVDAYLMRGNLLIALSTAEQSSREDVTYYRQLARGLFDAALGARPDSPEALTGLAILDMIENKNESAQRLAEAASRAAPEYAAAPYLLSLLYQLGSERAGVAATSREGEAARFRVAGQREDESKALAEARRLNEESRRLAGLSAAAIRLAATLDRPNLEGRSVPSVFDAWRYFAQFARPPLVILGD